MKRRSRFEDFLAIALIAAFLIAAIGLAAHFYRAQGEGRRSTEGHYRTAE